MEGELHLGEGEGLLTTTRLGDTLESKRGLGQLCGSEFLACPRSDPLTDISALARWIR